MLFFFTYEDLIPVRNTLCYMPSQPNYKLLKRQDGSSPAHQIRDVRHYQENLFSTLLSKKKMENLGKEEFERW